MPPETDTESTVHLLNNLLQRRRSIAKSPHTTDALIENMLRPRADTVSQSPETTSAADSSIEDSQLFLDGSGRSRASTVVKKTSPRPRSSAIDSRPPPPMDNKALTVLRDHLDVLYAMYSLQNENASVSELKLTLKILVEWRRKYLRKVDNSPIKLPRTIQGAQTRDQLREAAKLGLKHYKTDKYENMMSFLAALVKHISEKSEQRAKTAFCDETQFADLLRKWGAVLSEKVDALKTEGLIEKDEFTSMILASIEDIANNKYPKYSDVMDSTVMHFLEEHIPLETQQECISQQAKDSAKLNARQNLGIFGQLRLQLEDVVSAGQSVFEDIFSGIVP